jgi:hypothetical protein
MRPPQRPSAALPDKFDDSTLVQSAGAGLILCHHRPIVLAFAARERAHQAVAPHIAARQRHADRFSRGPPETFRLG